MENQDQVRVNREGTTPLYQQVAAHLRQEIESTRLAPGDRLPGTAELCSMFGGLNHQTIRQAVGVLREANLVEAIPGKGTFVKTAVEHRHVALVLPNFEDEVQVTIAAGVRDFFKETSIRAVLLDSHNDTQEEVNMLQRISDLGLDGAIVFPLPDGRAAEPILTMKIQGFPIVLVDRHFPDLTIPSVTVDNYDGGRLATAHLLERGYKRIGCLASRQFSSSRDRLEGYRDGLAEGGHVYRREWVREVAMATTGQPEPGSVREAIEALLALPVRPEALVVVNDPTALMAMQVLKEQKVKVPEEMALVGFDDLKAAEWGSPKLTTIRQPLRKMGARAARAIQLLMNGEGIPDPREQLPVELVVREST